MKNKLSNWLSREILVLLGLAAVGVVWFVLMDWVIPFVYEAVSRFYSLDYSYLWNGVSSKVRQSAPLGFIILAIFYLFYLAARLLKGVARILFEDRRSQYPTGPFQGIFVHEKISLERVLLREFATAMVIVVCSSAVLYCTRDNYLKLKKQYFSEVVSTQEGFQNLSDQEKLKAIGQYDQMSTDAVVGGMLRDFGLHAQSVYRLQHISFWILIWGYPGILLLRSILWAMHMLREDI